MEIWIFEISETMAVLVILSFTGLMERRNLKQLLDAKEFNFKSEISNVLHIFSGIVLNSQTTIRETVQSWFGKKQTAIPKSDFILTLDDPQSDQAEKLIDEKIQHLREAKDEIKKLQKEMGIDDSSSDESSTD
jgi:predicted transcriptional regulator